MAINIILERYQNETFYNEDGEELKMLPNKGASNLSLTEFESLNSCILEESFKDLYSFSDGMDLFGLEIMSLDQIVRDNDLLPFHNWGNGDFECLSVGERYPVGSIIFKSFNQEVLISSNLSNWLRNAIIEIKFNGTYLHPAESAVDFKVSGNRSEIDQTQSRIYMTKPIDLIQVLTNPKFNELETLICTSNKCTLYQENLPMLAKFQSGEVELSSFTVAELVSYLEDNNTRILDFSNKYIQLKKLQTLSSGFTITYAIYLKMLESDGEDALLQFLEKRRIPNAKSVFKEIKNTVDSFKE